MLLLSEAVETGSGSETRNDAGGKHQSHGERRRGLRIRQHRPVKVYEPAGARYFGGQPFRPVRVMSPKRLAPIVSAGGDGETVGGQRGGLRQAPAAAPSNPHTASS